MKHAASLLARAQDEAKLGSSLALVLSRQPSTDEGSTGDHRRGSVADDTSSDAGSSLSSDSSSSDDEPPSGPASGWTARRPQGRSFDDTTVAAPPSPSCAWMRIRTPSPDTRREIMEWGLLTPPCVEHFTGDSSPCMPNSSVGGAEVLPQHSSGSAGHPFCCADPCKFARTRRGCRDGDACDRCHLCVWRKPLGDSPPWRRCDRQGRPRKGFAALPATRCAK
mmetsp:Transcript_9491/g.27060  ORF Transcript_9491/g.27060 Transcript_9491/m.27060 type:complete len:222 (-) Transcript_9491:56-721(-)